MDRWLLAHLADTVAEATAAFEGHDYMQAHQAASRMFWSVFCDRYLEMIKDRLGGTDRGRSARWTLWESFRVLLGLFAPFAPFVTEHMYQQFYAPHEGTVSLHLTRWPAADERWRGDRGRGGGRGPARGDPGRHPGAAQRRSGSATRPGCSQLIVQAHDAGGPALLDQIAEPLRVAARADALVRGPAGAPQRRRRNHRRDRRLGPGRLAQCSGANYCARGADRVLFSVDYGAAEPGERAGRESGGTAGA